MLGPPTPHHFLDELPPHYKVAHYPERTQPYTIWLRDKVVRFETAEMGARKWVERAAERRAEQEPVALRTMVAYPVLERLIPSAMTTTVNYWELPKPSDRAEVIE